MSARANVTRDAGTERRSPRVSSGAEDRRHLRHDRGNEARVLVERSRLVQPRTGPARDGRAPRRAEAHPVRRDRAGRSGVRAGGRALGAPRSGREPLQPALSEGPALAVFGRERLHLRWRSHRAHARGREPRQHQPRALHPGLHRVRRAPRHLQGVHEHPDPPRRRARLQLHRRRPATRGARSRPLRGPPLEPVQPNWQARSRAKSSIAGSEWHASSTARFCSTSSIRTTSTAAVPAPSRSRARRGT